MSGTEFENNFKDELNRIRINNGEVFNTEELDNDEEIMKLLTNTVKTADELSPTGSRTPHDVSMLEKEEKRLKEDRRKREQQEAEDNAHRASWQTWANTQRQKRNDSLKREKINKITQLQNALKDPKVKDLLLKVRDRTILPEQAFDDINDNSSLKEKMMSLTRPLSKRVTDRGGKSRVFRRKNKKTTSTSRRNARRTRRHRKSSTRRSTRK